MSPNPPTTWRWQDNIKISRTHLNSSLLWPRAKNSASLILFSLPSLGHGVLPFAYFWFLLILLVHRSEWNESTANEHIVPGFSEMKRSALESTELAGRHTANKFHIGWYLAYSKTELINPIKYIFVKRNKEYNVYSIQTQSQQNNIPLPSQVRISHPLTECLLCSCPLWLWLSFWSRSKRWMP